MDNSFTTEQMERIKQELSEATLTEESPQVQALLRNWREHSPRMVKRLEHQEILEGYAIVTLTRFNKEVADLMSMSKMSMSEAQLYCKDSLLMDPEEDSQDLELEQD
jgi:hypothetical protein